MAYKSSRYTKAENQSLELRTLAVLAESPRAMTIDEICHTDLTLVGYTPQKMSRVLSSLIDKGFVFKTKSKASNRMVYMSAQQLEAQGYNLNDVIC